MEKQKKPKLFGLSARPNKLVHWVLLLMPFLIILGVYSYNSHLRHIENSVDKILPNFEQVKVAINEYALTVDSRTGENLFIKDTISSLKRILIGMLLSTIVSLFIGMNMGLFKGLESLLNPFVTAISMIPPLAVLPIILITLGVGEEAKIFLIFFGTVVIMTRSIFLSVKEIPEEQIIKARTLGANQLQVVYQVVMPQVIPKLIDNVRLAFGSAWIFLIAAEAIAADSGLGYRIFLKRRYLAMDLIIPLTVWISILGIFTDVLFAKIIEKKFAWYNVKK